MPTIQRQIQDDLVQQLGIGAVKHLLEEKLNYQQFRLLENRIQTAMHQADKTDWSQEFEEARQRAHEEYRQGRKSAL